MFDCVIEISIKAKTLNNRLLSLLRAGPTRRRDSLRNKPDAMLQHARNEYVRRGEPAAHTRWSVDEICRYQRWVLATAHPKMKDFGAMAHLLPEATGAYPAPLPRELLQWEQGKNTSRTRKRIEDEDEAPLVEPAPRKAAKVEKTPTRAAKAAIPKVAAPKAAAAKVATPKPKVATPKVVAPTDIPPSGYKSEFDKQSKVWMLVHEGMGLKAPLPGSTKTSHPKIYSDEYQNDVVWLGHDSEPQYCETLMASHMGQSDINKSLAHPTDVSRPVPNKTSRLKKAGPTRGLGVKNLNLNPLFSFVGNCQHHACFCLMLRFIG